MNRWMAYLISFALLFVVTSCDDDDEGNILIEVGTINDEISEDFDFTILEGAIEKAGLTSVLESDGPYTLLAPPDEAFIKAGITNLDRFTAEELTEILQYHLITDEVLFAELSPGAVQTENGDLYFTVAANRYFINGDTEFIQIDYVTTNGVIHTVEDVLMPPERTVTGLVTNDSDLSTLQAAVEKANLGDVLAGEGPYTVFAPTDRAFERLFEEMGITGINDLTADQLSNILQYHVLSERAFSTQLEAGMQNTLEGSDLRIIFDFDTILRDNSEMTDDALLLQANGLATNGVVHKINRVLLPE